MSGTVTTMQCTGIVQEMVVRRKSFTITASLYKDGIRMNNYYYNAPPDFTPDDVKQDGRWVERVTMRREV